jgi:hypothetical protein
MSVNTKYSAQIVEGEMDEGDEEPVVEVKPKAEEPKKMGI